MENDYEIDSNSFLNSLQKDTEILVNRSQHWPKINQIGASGYPKKAKKTKMNKRGCPSDFIAVLGAILKENGVQDGPENL